MGNIADYSTLLNDSNPITNVSFGVGEATITLQDTLPSNLTAGNAFIIRNALYKNEIVSLTPIVGVGYVVETSVNHDLTEEFQDTVQITGFGGAWDSTFDVVSVDTQTTFTISTSLAAPVGTGYVLENRYGTISLEPNEGITGAQTVSSVTSNTITFATTTPFQNYDLTNATANYGYRVTGAYNIESAQRHYNQRESLKKSWAYIIYDGSDVSKDNTIDSDSIGRHTKKDAFSQELILNFDILVLKDASDRNSAMRLQDELLDFRYPLLKSLLGLNITFENYVNSQLYFVSFLGDTPALYAGAYYGHLYSFQTQLVISTCETVENKNIAALRDFDIDLFLEFDNYEQVKKEIDMDFPN